MTSGIKVSIKDNSTLQGQIIKVSTGDKSFFTDRKKINKCQPQLLDRPSWPRCLVFQFLQLFCKHSHWLLILRQLILHTKQTLLTRLQAAADRGVRRHNILASVSLDVVNECVSGKTTDDVRFSIAEQNCYWVTAEEPQDLSSVTVFDFLTPCLMFITAKTACTQEANMSSITTAFCFETLQ